MAEVAKVHQVPRKPAAPAAPPTPIESSVGRGVNMVVVGSILTITIDLSKDFGPSKTGLTKIIASTDGNAAVVGARNGAVIGLNCYTKQK